MTDVFRLYVCAQVHKANVFSFLPKSQILPSQLFKIQNSAHLQS